MRALCTTPCTPDELSTMREVAGLARRDRIEKLQPLYYRPTELFLLSEIRHEHIRYMQYFNGFQLTVLQRVLQNCSLYPTQVGDKSVVCDIPEKFGHRDHQNCSYTSLYPMCTVYTGCVCIYRAVEETREYMVWNAHNAGTRN